jgi:hypothetical protein
MMIAKLDISCVMEQGAGLEPRDSGDCRVAYCYDRGDRWLGSASDPRAGDRLNPNRLTHLQLPATHGTPWGDSPGRGQSHEVAKRIAWGRATGEAERHPRSGETKNWAPRNGCNMKHGFYAKEPFYYLITKMLSSIIRNQREAIIGRGFCFMRLSSMWS